MAAWTQNVKVIIGDTPIENILLTQIFRLIYGLKLFAQAFVMNMWPIHILCFQ
jgi:hypothetical protein